MTQRFADSYMSQHPGFYITGDGGYRDSDGYLYVMGRIDDVINVACDWLSTGQMEEVLASHPAVAECAVIGVNDDFKGQIPRGFVVLKAGVSADPAALSAELVQLIRDQIGPVAALRRVDVVAALPRPDPARYSARPCGASPTVRTSSPRPPSRTPPSSTRSARSWPTATDPARGRLRPRPHRAAAGGRVREQ